jgi:hypothetical protein
MTAMGEKRPAAWSIRAYGWLLLALAALAVAAALVLYALPEPAADGTVTTREVANDE